MDPEVFELRMMGWITEVGCKIKTKIPYLCPPFHQTAWRSLFHTELHIPNNLESWSIFRIWESLEHFNYLIWVLLEWCWWWTEETEELDFWPTEPQIFKNYISLAASNVWPSNRKFSATSVDFVNFWSFSLYLNLKRSKDLAAWQLHGTFGPLSLILGILIATRGSTRKWGCL